MREVLAVDAGGTSTRAVLVDQEGRCRGYGRGASGNPTSGGPVRAAASVAAAIAQALTGPGTDPAGAEVVLVAHAGGHDDFQTGIERHLAALGVRAPVTRAGDLAALFASGTHEPDGAAMLAGTGAIGGAIRGGVLEQTVDGTGWLLGDSGSGFWIGHRLARAVVEDLDGGASTALTAALLDRLGIARGEGWADSRPRVLTELIHRLYALRPVELSAFAPLAFRHVADDVVARGILTEAVGLLTALLVRVRLLQPTGPLVVGGSVLVEGILRLPAEVLAPLLAVARDPEPIPVADGLVGAAVLALRADGIEVDAALHARLASGIAAAAAGWTPPV